MNVDSVLLEIMFRVKCAAAQLTHKLAKVFVLVLVPHNLLVVAVLEAAEAAAERLLPILADNWLLFYSSLTPLLSLLLLPYSSLTPLLLLLKEE